ncbi:MAG TPA: hypothetical protein EYQ81_10490, partial [Sneathiellales bacterium]|nr:hypothetical protein [Sneathiellales bacterium]
MTGAPNAAEGQPEKRVLPDLLNVCEAALGAADQLYQEVRSAIGSLVKSDGRVSGAALEANQFAVHGFAWFATYVEALRELLGWTRNLESEGRLGELETLILQAAYGEYLSQMSGGIAMSQIEVVRPADMRVSDDAVAAFATSAVSTLSANGNTSAVRSRIAELVTDGLDTGNFGDLGLDETLNMVRDQFRRFAEEQVAPFAHDWHLQDEFIPMTVINQMSELGVFGLTIPESYGGLGMGKISMCVVTEELSRGYIGVGSLGTRSEIAAELILGGGTDAQKENWLPGIASGDVLPTAVFTEPNVGSDLGSLRTRAIKDGDVYKVTGNKTWITHAARTDVMTEGIVNAWAELKPTLPVFFTIHGTNEEEAIALVRDRLGMEPYDLMDDAVKAAVQAAKEAAR